VGKKFKRMSLEEREYIGILLAKGESLRSIGKELGRNHSSLDDKTPYEAYWKLPICRSLSDKIPAASACVRFPSITL